MDHLRAEAETRGCANTGEKEGWNEMRPRRFNPKPLKIDKPTMAVISSIGRMDACQRDGIPTSKHPSRRATSL